MELKGQSRILIGDKYAGSMGYDQYVGTKGTISGTGKNFPHIPIYINVPLTYGITGKCYWVAIDEALEILYDVHEEDCIPLREIDESFVKA